VCNLIKINISYMSDVAAAGFSHAVWMGTDAMLVMLESHSCFEQK